MTVDWTPKNKVSGLFEQLLEFWIGAEYPLLFPITDDNLRFPQKYAVKARNSKKLVFKMVQAMNDIYFTDVSPFKSLFVRFLRILRL